MTAARTASLILAAACGFGACASASAQTFNCPATFPMQVLRFGAADDGWNAGTGDAAPLTSMALFSGPPSEFAMLKPTSANGKRESWTLEPPYKDGLWLQCAYGSNSLTLSKPLASTPKVCVATYGKEHPHQPRAIEFVCH